MSQECLQGKIAGFFTAETKHDQNRFLEDWVQSGEPRVEADTNNRCNYEFTCEAAELGCRAKFIVNAFGYLPIKATAVDIIWCKSD